MRDDLGISGIATEVIATEKGILLLYELLKLFSIGELDEDLKIKIKCIARLPRNNSEYILEIKRDFVSVSIDGVEQNIREYLGTFDV